MSVAFQRSYVLKKNKIIVVEQFVYEGEWGGEQDTLPPPPPAVNIGLLKQFVANARIENHQLVASQKSTMTNDRICKYEKARCSGKRGESVVLSVRKSYLGSTRRTI